MYSALILALQVASLALAHPAEPVSTGLTFASSNISGPLTLPQTPEEALVDHYLFTLPLDNFIRRRNNRDPPNLNWSSDNCTHAPNNPLGFPFKPACQRHDFGYRNYKGEHRFTGEAKSRIDYNFKAE